MSYDDLDGALPDPDLVPPEAAPDEEPDDEDEDDPDPDAEVRRDARGRPIVTVGGVDVALGVPRSPTLIMEAVALVGASAVRGYSACLALCWLAGGASGAPKARLERCGYVAAVWGAQVYDELIRRGVPPDELLAAGAAAFRLLVSHNVKPKEIGAAKGF